MPKQTDEGENVVPFLPTEYADVNRVLADFVRGIVWRIWSVVKLRR